MDLFVVGLIAFAVYWAGWAVGRRDGRAEAMGWRYEVNRMGDQFETTRFDEPGSPRLN